MNGPCLACLVVACSAIGLPAAEIHVLVPTEGAEAYRIAGNAFADLWEKVTGRRPAVTGCRAGDRRLPQGDLALVGSDAVHPLVHRLILEGKVESLGIRYGGDGYRILCVPYSGRRCLILAGGSGRSTLYAVYDFFRRRAGVEYFWDGDVVPKRESIELDGVDVSEGPRFEWRGLRYFAHRGLHRFQAEHWDLDDWKREIDWIVKKRLNLFMLRTGIDDLFQRALADVPYPPTDAKDPDGVDRSYDDRTSFWPLRYRGELRKEVLRYARDRGLIHPEDTGTLTHWYSHTPSAFFKNRPDFPVTADQKRGYTLPTAAIWDVEDQRAWDTYWKLTQTHIREFGGGVPRMFHTIGLAERVFGKDDRENLQRKLYVYRKTQEMLRERHPDVPLLIAGWDFIGWWKDEDVRRLLREFDPARTIIFDYTADDADKVTFRDWGLLGGFPWIFGIFYSFARNSDIHEDYGLLAERLRLAAADEKCLGLALWPEISHSDTFLLEYLAANSWQPTGLDVEAAVARYCRTRYPAALTATMQGVWKDFLVASQSVHWTHGGSTRTLSFGEPQFRVLSTGAFVTLTPERLAALRAEYQRIGPALAPAPAVLSRLAELAAKRQDDPLWRRDAIDMARTIASRALLVTMMKGSLEMEAWRAGTGDAARVRELAEVSRRLMDCLADTLALSDEFSMHASLARLKRAKPLSGVEPTINPHSEATLKSNAENDYCRSHHYELVRHVYRAELEAFWAWVLGRIESGATAPWRLPPDLSKQAKTIEDRFYATPLAAMAPARDETSAPPADILRRLDSAVRQALETTRK